MTKRNMQNSKPDIRVVNGQFDYPSTRGRGFDPIDYPRRAPMVGGKVGAPQIVAIKMRELPDLIMRDLKYAHQEGQLREELKRHLDLLEANQFVDKGTLTLLRDFESHLVGRAGPDAETLKGVTEVIKTLRPTERQP